MPPVACKVAPA
jgi:hypothetical protein